jgi:hypothetical protein
MVKKTKKPSKEKGKGKATVQPDVERAGVLRDVYQPESPVPDVTSEKVGKGVLGVEKGPVPEKMIVKFARPQTKVRRVARSAGLGALDLLDDKEEDISSVLPPRKLWIRLTLATRMWRALVNCR